MLKLIHEKKKNLLTSSNAGRLTAYKLRHQLLVSKMRKDKRVLQGRFQCLKKKVQKLTDDGEFQKMRDEQRWTKKCLKEMKRWTQLRKEDMLESNRSSALEHLVNEEILLKKIQELETERDMLKGEVADLKVDKQPTSISSKAKNRYDLPIRKALYRCLQHQVPVEAASSLVQQIVSDMTGVTITEMPSVGTISNMAYEMGVISDIHAGQILMKETHLCIGFDATSLDGDHINEVHVYHVSGPSLVLQIGTLAGGTRDDYAEHIKNTLNDIASTQAAFTGEDLHTVKSTMISSLSSTISDRCSVNHCVIEILKTDLDLDLLELNCNVHPLDGLAHKSRQVLKKVDANLEVNSELFGNDCRAANVIFALSKMRYKQGKGDPAGFKFFMKQENIRRGLIVRYVGNRLHVLFHLAGIFFMLSGQLQLYLDKYCQNTTNLKTALQKDLRHPIIIMQLQCLGLLGKFLTGPWMREFYANASKRINLEMIPLMHKCMSSLTDLKNNPLQMLTSRRDVFQNTLEPDSVFTSLQAPPADIEQEEILSLIMTSLLVGAEKLLSKQLKRYLSGDLANPSSDVLTQGESAPTHNIFSEQTLGMVDHQFCRAPNATFGFIDGKIKFIKNSIDAWIDSQPEYQQRKIVEFVIGRGRDMRALLKKRDEVVQRALSERQKQKEQKRDKTKRNKLQKKVKQVLDGALELEEISESEMTEEMMVVIKELICNPASFKGKYINHLWDDNSKDVMYHGKIIKMKCMKTRGKAFEITYWGDNESEEDSEDSVVLLVDIIVDVIFKDLCIFY